MKATSTATAPLDGKMQLQRLTMENFRQFERLTLDFHPNLTVLVGANGSGKTSVLDAVLMGVKHFADAMMQRTTPVGIVPTDIRRMRAPNGKMVEALPVTVGGVWDVGQGGEAWACERTTTNGKTSYKAAKALKNHADGLLAELKAYASEKVPAPPCLPLVAYYGTKRLWGTERMSKGKLVKATRFDAPVDAYAGSLESTANFKAFRAWYEAVFGESAMEERLDIDSVNRPTDLILAIIQSTNRVLAETGWQDLYYSFLDKDVVAQHADLGSLPVSMLSDGIRTAIGLCADIAHRCVRLNSHMGAGAPWFTPGIVLIDEVDMHLHPSWQQTILGGLRTAFPEIQFIVTTHSPQVLSTVSADHIRIISRDSEGQWSADKPSESPLARSAEDALARIQGVSPRPPLPVQDDIRRFEALVRAGDEAGAEASALQSRLDAAGVELPAAELTTWRFLASRKKKTANG